MGPAPDPSVSLSAASGRDTAPQSLPALPEPSTATVAAMHDGCRAVEAWMEATDGIAALAQADDWLDAVETYLSAKNAEGPAQTTHRLLDARGGHLMRAGPGYGHPEKA